MRRLSRLFVVLVATLSLAAAGFVLTSAQAADNASIEGKVVDANGTPLRGITVFGFPKSDAENVIYLTTNSQGEFASWHSESFTTGAYELLFSDGAHEYAEENVDVSLHAGSNSVPTVTMQLGGRASGSVTSVSGKPIRNMTVSASNLGEASAATDDQDGGGFDRTDADGRFEFVTMEVGEYEVLREFLPEDEDSGVSFEITAPGEVVATPLAFTNVRVAARKSLKASSPSRHRATIKVAVSATSYGIPASGGKVDVYDGSKKIKSAVSLTGNLRTVNVSGLKSGRHVFRFRYLGGVDVLSGWSSRVAVTIK